nr:ankyrin repeat domain-containing protein [uncultured Undibacterium sp.]
MRLGSISPETDVDTRLHEAAEAGDLLAVKSLLSQGCAINAIDICGRTPLHFAAGNNQLGMVEYLVSVGADVNGQADAKDGKITLHWDTLWRLVLSRWLNYFFNLEQIQNARVGWDSQRLILRKID